MGMAKDSAFEDLKAARELCYPDSVILALKHEKSDRKRQNILHDARLGIFPEVTNEMKQLNYEDNLREGLKKYLKKTHYSFVKMAGLIDYRNGNDLSLWMEGKYRLSNESLDKIERYLKGVGAL